jgi:hypothetical protein
VILCEVLTTDRVVGPTERAFKHKYYFDGGECCKDGSLFIEEVDRAGYQIRILGLDIQTRAYPEVGIMLSVAENSNRSPVIGNCTRNDDTRPVIFIGRLLYRVPGRQYNDIIYLFAISMRADIDADYDLGLYGFSKRRLLR